MPKSDRRYASLVNSYIIVYFLNTFYESCSVLKNDQVISFNKSHLQFNLTGPKKLRLNVRFVIQTAVIQDVHKNNSINS